MEVETFLYYHHLSFEKETDIFTLVILVARWRQFYNNLNIFKVCSSFLYLMNNCVPEWVDGKKEALGLDREGETHYIYACNIPANIPIHLIKSLLKAIFNACDDNHFSLKTLIPGVWGGKSTRFRNQ